MKIGVDIGGSLTKIVTDSGGERGYCLLEHVDGAEVAEALPAAGEICVAGCGAEDLAKRLGARARIRDELRSVCAGARLLMREQYGDTKPFVLASVGTGTSVFYVSPEEGTRDSGTGMGGGTITGLGHLLLTTSDFGRIMDLASQGDRTRVDLMVSDLYPNAARSPVLSALTAANFGRAAGQRSTTGASRASGTGTRMVSTVCAPRVSAMGAPAAAADIASAIVQMVVETVAVISIQVARTHRTRTIVIAGSPGSHPVIRRRFGEIGDYLGHEFAFLEHGAFCGALGAILETP